MSKERSSFIVLSINAVLTTYLSVALYTMIGTLIESWVILTVAPMFATIGAMWFCLDFVNYRRRITRKPLIIAAIAGPLWLILRWPFLSIIKSS